MYKRHHTRSPAYHSGNINVATPDNVEKGLKENVLGLIVI
jgi:hypothetical protein